MVFFKIPRDTSQISHLAKQMYPGKVKFIQESFENATKVPYGYLVIDLMILNKKQQNNFVCARLSFWMTVFNTYIYRKRNTHTSAGF